jgi:hypothetical protein
MVYRVIFPPVSTGPNSSLFSSLSRLPLVSCTPLTVQWDIVSLQFLLKHIEIGICSLHGPVVKGNTLGIVEYTPESYLPSDLDLFFKTYEPAAVGERPVFDSIDGKRQRKN